jgi:hypothetical protein
MSMLSLYYTYSYTISVTFSRPQGAWRDGKGLEIYTAVYKQSIKSESDNKYKTS